MEEEQEISLNNRFWNSVNIKNKDECWEWTGSLNKICGYGRMEVHGKKKLAHVTSWNIHFGEVPPGKFVLHKCDNKKCVNPNHLYLGTKSDNMYDMVTRGRSRMSRFYEGEAWLMKKLWRPGKFTQKQIAKIFRCSAQTVNDIIKGRTTNFRLIED